MMNHFCTYCDQGYAARLLCLHDSLRAQGQPFRLEVLCFDQATEAVVANVNSPMLVAIPLQELLLADPEYAAARSSRSKVEFYFTSTPVLVRYCLMRDPGIQGMTYLDSDLYFFGAASLVFAEQGDASVGIVPHRFPSRLSELNKHGIYNVAWVSFRRDAAGLACVEWWRERCLEWCHDYLDQGRFADQGYLDEFPRKFPGVRILGHAGINAAPWNMDEKEIVSRSGRLYLNDQPLLFYHFQGIRELLPGWFELGLKSYQTNLTPELRHLIYLPYLRKLMAVQRGLRETHGIMPQLGFQRLPAGKSWRERWGRIVARWLMPRYRRYRGQLLHCPEASIE